MNALLRNCLIALLLCTTTGINAQVTNLSGTLTTSTTTVSSMAASSVDVASVTGFNTGDTVLIIQMKGVDMDTSNTSSFGNINGIDNAGNFELALVCSVSGQTINFQSPLSNAYSPNGGYVQLIRVPNYTNVDVTAELTAPAWDNSTGMGGVLIFSASGWVNLSADINMDGKGFEGGWSQFDYSNCNCGCGTSTEYTNYFYDYGNCRSAGKGEGIRATLLNKEFGMGKQSNGGGGGNDHNTGGGGGANYGSGGLGGNATAPSCFLGAYCEGNYPGVGGAALNSYYGSNKIFLGGGGGAGHANNLAGMDGGAGAGIVIILADSLNSTGGNITAKGLGSTTYNDGDGAGAGGAGGCVLLDVNSISNSPFSIDVSGGNGGNVDAYNANNCKGPGGGGGGGVIWSTNILQGGTTANISGGVSGIQTGPNCTGQTMGALAGGSGGTMTGLSLNIGNSGSPSGVDVQTACESYTWIDGITYTSDNNTATWTLTNAAGCDSIVTLDLTIQSAINTADIVTACNSFVWTDGNTYTSSNNTAIQTLTSSNGCDSVVTLDLTILNATAGVDVITACESYTWIDGNNYTTSNNIATYTLTNEVGCDSVVTLDLTIGSLPDISVSQNGEILTANQSGATYQWLDCNDSNASINGATDQSYTPTASGNYAVHISLNNCSDTSSCYLVDVNGIKELLPGQRELIRVTDLLGRETTPEKNRVLIYIYSDGTIERIYEFK